MSFPTEITDEKERVPFTLLYENYFSNSYVNKIKRVIFRYANNSFFEASGNKGESELNSQFRYCLETSNLDRRILKYLEEFEKEIIEPKWDEFLEIKLEYLKNLYK